MGIKVAMFGPFYGKPVAGGVEQHVFHLSNSLEKLGVAVERWSWKVSSDTDDIRKFSLFGLGKVLTETDADLVHFHSTAIAASYFSGLGGFSDRAVATIHSFYHPEFENSLRMKALSHALSRPYVGALKRTKNIAVSRGTAEEARRHGVNPLAIIGNGISLGDFVEVQPQDSLKSDVIMVGRFTEQKGVFDFIKAFENSGLHVLLAGYGDAATEKKVAEMCKKAGITCIVRPERDLVLSAMKSSKVLAFPSKYEPFGIVGLEAMALGVPVVVYKEAGGPLDYVRDEWNGVVVESNSSWLREGVLRLLKDEKLRTGMGRNALQTAKENYWLKVARRVKKFYLRVLEGGLIR